VQTGFKQSGHAQLIEIFKAGGQGQAATPEGIKPPLAMTRYQMRCS
jgi:hypothetical protein